MIYLAAEYFFLCAVNSAHPTIFVDDGKCVAMCDASSDYPHGCYDSYGHSLTDCFDDNRNSGLCDAYIYAVTPDDYEVVEK
jgi:hypothetical protein